MFTYLEIGKNTFKYEYKVGEKILLKYKNRKNNILSRLYFAYSKGYSGSIKIELETGDFFIIIVPEKSKESQFELKFENVEEALGQTIILKDADVTYITLELSHRDLTRSKLKSSFAIQIE